ARGRLERVYRGTNDIHDFWGDHCDQNVENCAPCSQDQEGHCVYPDNLVLIEKRYYGAGVTDADQLWRVRHYRSPPQNQYGGSDPQHQSHEDHVGWRTEHEYDWRMREVVVKRFAEDVDGGGGGTPLNQTVTWLDH